MADINTLSVDQKKCGGDGACAAVCPIRILEIGKDTRVPGFVEGGEKACINCGHCVTVCPTGALSLASMPVDSCRTLAKDWRILPEPLEQFMKGRRSIRAYKDDIVDRAILERLIDTARYAPSGINRQPVNWAVVHDVKKVKDLSRLVAEWMRTLIAQKSPLAESLRMQNIIAMYDRGEDPITRGAPHVIIAYSLKDDMTAPQACTIALTYFELMAASMGLGTCWAGYVQMAINMDLEIQKFLGLSRKTNAFGALMIGYQKYRYARIPLRNDPHVIWR